MAKKGYTPEQIINKLREAEILLSQGGKIAVVSKKIGVSGHTCYRWRKEYGGMKGRPGSSSQGTGAGKCPFKEAGGRPFP